MGLILVRYGEIALKGVNRNLFIKRLRHNIRDCLKKKGITGEIYSSRGRLFVRTDDVDTAVDGVRKVFGVVSVSPVHEVEQDIEAIKVKALEVARELELDRNVTFRVTARRADKTFPLISPEIDREVGGYVFEETGTPVDLKNPMHTIGIEVRREGVYVYGKVLPGPGGLPLGIEGCVVALISGGIDSPVAAWLMMKRGCGVIPVHFRQSEAGERKAIENCRVLSEYAFGWDILPIVLDHAEVLGEIPQQLHLMGEERWTCVFCKRAIAQKAAEIAEEVGASALVMGDSLGQVASQTLHNIEVVSYGISKPILRPLIGMDKIEIVNLAKKIGTFETSISSSEECPFLPPRPLTKGTIPKLQQLLARLGEPTSDSSSDENET